MHFDEEMGFQHLGPGITVLSPSDPRPPTVRFDSIVVLAGGHRRCIGLGGVGFGGYQWLLLSAGRPRWQIGLKFQCRDRSREVEGRGQRPLKLQAGRVTDVGVCVEVSFGGICRWCPDGKAVAGRMRGGLVG